MLHCLWMWSIKAALVVIGALMVVGFSLEARADIYKYTDPSGVVYFTNRPRRGKKWKRVLRSGSGSGSTSRRRSRSGRRRVSLAKRYERYKKHIIQASALYHIPIPLIQAVITVESGYTPRAVSRAGAKGMMQLMPSVARGMGVTDPFDPRQNIFGGTRLLRILANRFDGDLVICLAAYHAGSGAVRKYGGIPPYQSTQQYVRAVLSHYYRLKRRVARTTTATTPDQ